MRDIRIGAAQFEHRNADKSYNLSVMKKLTATAVEKGAEMISFHEACIPAYTFLRGRSKAKLPSPRGARVRGAKPPALRTESAMVWPSRGPRITRVEDLAPP